MTFFSLYWTNQMNTYISSVPAWVSALFLLTFPLAVVLIATVVRNAARHAGFDANRTRAVTTAVYGFYAVFLLATSVLTLTGVFAANMLPPRPLLFAAFPYALILIGVVSRNTRFRMLIEYALVEDLVRVHIFRLVGIFFLIGAYYEVLPTRFALVAGLGDIITALGAFVVAKAVQERKEWSVAALLIWNIIGTADILTVVFSALIETRYAIANGTQGVAGIAQFPFSWIPAFAPVTILFLHFYVFAKLKAYKQSLVKSA